MNTAMKYAAGFGTLKASVFAATSSIEAMLEHKEHFEMNSYAADELRYLLKYLKEAGERGDAEVQKEASSEPYYISPQYGVLETKEQFDALMDDIDEDTSPCNYPKGK